MQVNKHTQTPTTMKKIATILTTIAMAMTINAQDYYIGGGFGLSFISQPDNTINNALELEISGQYDNLDLMLGIMLEDEVKGVEQTNIGIYAGRNIGRFTLGGHVGYYLAETKYNYQTYQSDMLILGAYAKFSVTEHIKLFAAYRFGYDNNNNYSKFCDRGFTIGFTVGFSHSDKEYSTQYYYN